MIKKMKKRKTTDKKRIIRNETDKLSCYCPRLEIRVEDFTFKRFGLEVTRTLELLVCLDCGESQIPGGPVLQMEAELTEKVLALANERLEVLKGYGYLEYYDDVDILYIPYSNTDSVISKSDIEKGLIYDFDSEGKLTGIEVIDFYGKFVEEDNDIRAARAAKKEYLATGESYTVEDLRAEFDL